LPPITWSNQYVVQLLGDFSLHHSNTCTNDVSNTEEAMIKVRKLMAYQPPYSNTPNGLLLTPSPLLSSIHFWSSLSPIAPLSPARLQGPNTLFQFPTLLNGHIPMQIPSLDGASSPVLLSPNAHKS
uniref:Uncharacterized protein n=1 Tax=Laticauda laticaudata TaxID=8630 RepID=A0A8C5S2B7_LATLA